jgi:hypothetical protein
MANEIARFGFSRAKFSRKLRQDDFSKLRGAAGRKAFRDFIDVLARQDAEDPDAFARRCLTWTDELFSGCGPLEGLKAYFDFGLEAPVRYRRKLSPRLDFTGVTTYAGVAKSLCGIIGDIAMERLRSKLESQSVQPGAGRNFEMIVA